MKIQYRHQKFQVDARNNVKLQVDHEKLFIPKFKYKIKE